MKKRFLGVLVTFLFAGLSARAQDTFSIVAVDTVTGEVGSAGASCIEQSVIISDVHPGIGVIHTQSFWRPENQSTGYELMRAGRGAQEIIDSLIQRDVEGKPYFRQYGVVTLLGPNRSAGYTGDSCMNTKYHTTGKDYAVQGNILLGRSVIDSIEARYLRATGTLADRLMAALQGANLPGADSRCMSNGTSSLSAFIRVAKPEDDYDVYYLDINLPRVKPGIEPIDSLQTRFNAWKGTARVASTLPAPNLFYPNPARSVTHIRLPLDDLIGATCILIDARGEQFHPETQITGNEVSVLRNSLPAGRYYCKIVRGSTALVEGPVVFE